MLCNGLQHIQSSMVTVPGAWCVLDGAMIVSIIAMQGGAMLKANPTK